MPNRTHRPSCPKCSMHMIATEKVLNSKQAFECLRCGHQETRRIEERGLTNLKVMLA